VRIADKLGLTLSMGNGLYAFSRGGSVSGSSRRA
jgi:hypothetical protein